MFFLLRSLFWLGLVFSAMWTGETSPSASLRPAEFAQTATRKAMALAGDYCSASPMECLQAAQKLHELFEKVSAEPEILESPVEIEGPPAATLPIPPVRPVGLSAADRLPGWRGKPAL